MARIETEKQKKKGWGIKENHSQEEKHCRNRVQGQIHKIKKKTLKIKPNQLSKEIFTIKERNTIKGKKNLKLKVRKEI